MLYTMADMTQVTFAPTLSRVLVVSTIVSATSSPTQVDTGLTLRSDIVSRLEDFILRPIFDNRNTFHGIVSVNSLEA